MRTDFYDLQLMENQQEIAWCLVEDHNANLAKEHNVNFKNNRSTDL